jgi:hypothetical protein
LGKKCDGFHIEAGKISYNTTYKALIEQSNWLKGFYREPLKLRLRQTKPVKDPLERGEERQTAQSSIG